MREAPGKKISPTPKTRVTRPLLLGLLVIHADQIVILTGAVTVK